MSDNRVRGEDMEIRIISDGELEATLTAIQSFEMTVQTEVKTDRFLGENAPRKSMAYNGVSGRMGIQPEGPEFFLFQQKVKDKAQRRTPSVRFDVFGTLLWPDGRVTQAIIPDVSFGSIPLSAGGGTEYITSTIEFEAADFEPLEG